MKCGIAPWPAVLSLLLIVFTTAGCGYEAPAVLIVEDGENVQILGEVEFVNDGTGFRPDVWKEGNVVVFKVDGDFGDQHGIAGRAYRITADKTLEDLTAIDPTSSNREIAREFGITMEDGGG